ncbi:hypothetical protein LVY75_23460 [Sinorhizobium sp. B11]
MARHAKTQWQEPLRRADDALRNPIISRVTTGAWVLSRPCPAIEKRRFRSRQPCMGDKPHHVRFANIMCSIISVFTLPQSMFHAPRTNDLIHSGTTALP